MKTRDTLTATRKIIGAVTSPQVGIGLVLLLIGLLAFAVRYADAQIANGTVMASTGNGRVTEFDQNGNLLGQLNTGTSNETTGSGFDSAGNFFVADFAANQVTKFDPNGALIVPFGGPYNADPESITFDAAGNVYVGQADGTRSVLKFNSSGTLLATFSPAIGCCRGADVIELASDQCTLFYTTYDSFVKRFDVCTNTQLADFNTVPLRVPFEHRLLPSGGILVATGSSEVIRLDASGALIQTYTLPAVFLYALTLDPDGTSFWTAELRGSGKVFKVDIASGSIVKQWSAAGAPNFLEIGGLSVKGEICTPPTISDVSATPSVLWPPDHRFVTVTVAYTATSPCDGTCTLSVSSNEGVNARGSGNTAPDWVVVDGHTVQLRAERSGLGDGRVYTITIKCTNSSGKSSSQTVTVSVPHDQG